MLLAFNARDDFPLLFMTAPEDIARFRPLVRGVVSAILKEPIGSPDVDDCTGETMRRALEKDASRTGELRPWLLGIARHVALDTIRARQKDRARHSSVPAAPSSESAVVDRLIDPEKSAEALLLDAQERARVERALARLPEGTRRALHLFHSEQKEYADIAKELDVPLGTVATWITRGRKRLAEILEQDTSWTDQ